MGGTDHILVVSEVGVEGSSDMPDISPSSQISLTLRERCYRITSDVYI